MLDPYIEGIQWLWGLFAGTYWVLGICKSLQNSSGWSSLSCYETFLPQREEALKMFPATLYPLIHDHLYQVHSLRDPQRTSSSVSAQTGDTLGLHHFLIHFYSSNVDRMFLFSPFTSPLMLCCNCAAMHNDTLLLIQQAFLTNERNDWRD